MVECMRAKFQRLTWSCCMSSQTLGELCLRIVELYLDNCLEPVACAYRDSDKSVATTT